MQTLVAVGRTGSMIAVSDAHHTLRPIMERNGDVGATFASMPVNQGDELAYPYIGSQAQRQHCVG